MQEASNRNLIIGIAAVTVLIFAGLTWLILSVPPDQGDTNGTISGQEEAVSFDDRNDPTVGPASAKVVVRLYSDLQCPACRSAEAGVKYAMEKFSDRVMFVWKDFPLETIHKNARSAANAARCAAKQDPDLFWTYHDKLYDVQPDWSGERDPQEKFRAYARELNLDEASFNSCYASRVEDGKVAADLAEGLRNNVDRTPTFFVNNRRYFGMSPTEWERVLTEALRVAATTSTAPSP